jgi:subtilase family serine protease
VARRLLLAAAAVIALAATSFTSAADAAPVAFGPAAAPAASHVTTARACPAATRGHAACTALRRTDATATAATQRMSAAMAAARPGARPNVTPSGYGPADLQSAYKLSDASGGGRTVAIVDAYDDPTAEADLGVYRSQFGLPACTTANGCFRKVDQTGGTTSYPSTDAGWAEEISLDLDMVSAVCPGCHILLVETTSSSIANLGTGVNTAARMGAVAISNSYGGGDASDSVYGRYYNHPGIAVTASSGDSGYGVEFPASSHYVTAVGGTSLTRASNSRGWTESAWSGAGSGCSGYNVAVAPSSANTGCSRRAVADVSAVADPATGVAVYDTTVPSGGGGWLVFGGTSASSPIIASVYALAGNTGTSSSVSYPNTLPYANTGALFDVTTGSNGTCSPSQLCHARAGWDGPTGLGTPNGTVAF